MSKTPKPAPFAIIADTREQRPYHFTGIPRLFGYDSAEVVRAYLPEGDYSIAGHESRFAIERKSLEDLYSTLGQGRQRFEAEVERLNALDFAAIVIEADLGQIWKPAESRTDWQSRLHPKSVEGTIVSWSIRYPRVHWWTAGSRRAGEIRVFGACQKFWKWASEDRK